MEILKPDGIHTNVIRAGNENLFRSEIFANTVATLIEQEIGIYNIIGAICSKISVTTNRSSIKMAYKQVPVSHF